MKKNVGSDRGLHLSEKYFVNDLYEIIISSASEPREMISRLSSILREYIGAKEIVLFECDERLPYGHRLISRLHGEGEKRKIYFEIAQYTHAKLDEIRHFTRDGSEEAVSWFAELGYEDLIAVPIESLGNRLGCMHIYGSLQGEIYDQIARLIESIRPLLGVVLENYQLFHRMDQLLEERTESLRKANQRMENLIQTVPDLIIVTDKALTMEKIYNCQPEDYYFLQMAEGSKFSLYLTQAQQEHKREKIEGMADGELVHFVEEIRSGDRVNHLENRVQRNGNTYLHIIRNITDSVESQKQIAFMNRYDRTTGLMNRTMFFQKLKAMKGTKGVLLADINGLKLLNETLGFKMGDHYLQMLAKACERVRPRDADLFRVGDDEIAFLMRTQSSGEIKEIVMRLKAEVDQLNRTLFSKFPLSISCGFHVETDEEAPYETLFNIAENNLNQDKLLHSESNKSALVQTLTKALEARDFITEGHADRMEQLLDRFGQIMNLSSAVQTRLRLFGKFHDIGKVGISDQILFKPGSLTDEEMGMMKKHSEIGYKIALTAPDLHPIADFILKHHERYDGTGYPIGLAGEKIPLECRMLAIVDAYDAMTHDRPYRKALSHAAAVEELIRNKGSQFDPDLSDFFIERVLSKEGC